MTGNDESMSGSGKAKAWVGALSLLLIGLVLGVALDRHVLLRGTGGHVPTVHGNQAAGTPASVAAELHEAMMASLAERLDLDAEQRRQIDSIMGARHDLLRQTWNALHVQLGAAVDTVHRDIEAILSPEQRRAFREWARTMAPEP